MYELTEDFEREWAQTHTRTLKVSAELEVNMNGAVPITIESNESFDDDLFPADSVADVIKDEDGSVHPKTFADRAQSRQHIAATPAYRLPGEEDHYKYFATQNNVGPTIMAINYDVPVPANEVVLVFEVVGADAPTQAHIEVRDAATQTTEGLTVDVDAKGVARLGYDSGVPEWIDGPATSNDTLTIDRIRLVSVFGQTDVVLGIVKFAALAKFDVPSDKIKHFSSSVSPGEITPLNPMGRSIAGSAEFELSNEQGFFDSIVDFLYPNNKITFELYMEAAGQSMTMPYGVYYVDTWSKGLYKALSATATDFSKFLQQWEAPQSLYKLEWPNRVVKDMVHRLGVHDYSANFGTARKRGFFYADGKTTMWEELEGFSKALHAWFWFDKTGKLVIEGRDDRWTEGEVWHVSDTQQGHNLPSVIGHSQQISSNINSVKIYWTKHSITYEKVLWEESETTVLSASYLRNKSPVGPEDVNVHINRSDWEVFDDDGVIRINDEVMEYEKLDVPGLLRIKERGLYNTVPRSHRRLRNNTPLPEWDFQQSSSHNNITHGADAKPTLSHSHARWRGNSKVDIVNKNDNYRNMVRFGHGSHNFAAVGVELFFNQKPVRRHGKLYDRPRGGLYVHGGVENRSGIYFELLPNRPQSIVVYEIASDATRSTLYRAEARELVSDERYMLELLRIDPGGNEFIAFLNGERLTPKMNIPHSNTNGAIGVFIRNAGSMSVDHIYGIDNLNTSSFDLNYYGWVSTIGTGMAVPRSDLFRKANQVSGREVFYEDFGDTVHEGKQFDVEFTAPSKGKRKLFVSNDRHAQVYGYKTTPFDAEFALVSNSMEDKVVVGEDPATETNMSLFIHGFPVKFDDDENHNVEVKDEVAIRQHGKEEYEIKSKWISNRETAKFLGDIIIQNWSTGIDSIELDTLAFPFFDPGDNIRLTLEEQGSHLYKINSMSLSISSDSVSMSISCNKVA